MKGTYSIGKRLLALLLCVAMIAVYLPSMAMNVSAADEINKVADPSTMNDWENFFGPNKLSTEFAGGVWTDKSVFTDASAFSGVTMDDANSFLVAMSAIAASKKVEGQSSSPTDTMLVLDLSNSMDTIGAIPDMVDAANASIAKLLGMNSYNRVGVVLYSGNSQQGNASSDTATVILPLARYKANSSGKYLDYTGSTNNTWVVRADGMTYENNTDVSGTASKQTNGGTYIQNGLYKAWQEFEKVTDTTVSSGIMAGAKRTPIYILMSDGEPTVATTSYNSVGQSGIGDGTTPGNQTTRNQLTFLTQLTAAWAKGKAEDKYGTDAKFYTLGLGISENESATAVLSPASTNTTVAGWWTNFLAGTAGQNVEIYRNNYWSSWSLYRDAAVTERNYVDMFKSADNADELPGLFEEIVAAIEEEAYNVTLVVNENENLSGYITFEDEIGELMEVRDVKGILLGDVLFSGEELAKSVDDGLFDGTTAASDYGREFIATIQERIGITDSSVAEQLLISAYREGQISYNDATGEYSNYIGWYTAADGSFISFWDDDYGMGAEAAPEGATYITKSYGYLGASQSSDMMHVVVQVRTNIKTSHQTIVFKIPAALIPTVTYDVELDGIELEDASRLTREGAEPMRLLFEVGLRSDINAINIEQKVEEYLAADPAHHVHKHADGSYTFYTNSWGHGDEEHDPNYDEDLMDYVAESHFHPSYENERYYYTENTGIYVKNGDSYALYSGAQPSGDGYYHRRTVVTASSNGGSASVSYVYAPIAASTLAADNLLQDGSNWYVKAGVPYTELARFDILKGGNNTDTLAYANYPLVVHDTAGFNIYAVLGNNGRITLQPAQGIKLRKTVSETSAETNAPDSFEFTVTFDAQIAESNIKLTDADKNAFTGAYNIDSSSGKTVITVTLKDGEEVYITGIPTGTSYEVYETQTIYYNSDKEDDTVTGTVTANHIDDVVFTNAPRQYGQLTITKTVNHPFPGRPDALNNILFTVEVDLGAQAAGMSFPLSLVDGTQTPVADANGVITMTIKAEQTITIHGLLEDTPYEVREINVPQGFAWNQAASSGLVGEIGGAAHLVNDYVPTPPVTNPNVDIVINKTMTGDYTEDETFTFLVEQLNPATNQYEVLGAKTVHVAWPGSSTGTVSISDIVAGFTTLGSHTFRITETAGSTVGMTYSNQISTFQVNVVDPEMDGVLTVEVVPLINTTVAHNSNTYTVTANFTNVYSVGSTYVDVNIHKTLINETGVELPLTDFQFGLYTDPECTQLAQIVDGEHLTVYAGSLGNAVIRIPVTNVAQDGAVYYIKEIVPATPASGMTYSDAIYQVTLNVEAVEVSGVATLAAEAAIALYAGNGQVNGNEISFTNQFALTEVSAEIAGEKSYLRGYDNTPIALAGGEFTFELWTANADYTAGELLGTVSNAADGSFVFSGLNALTYSKVGRYTYILREVVGNNSAITYDPLDYYVLVIVTQGEGADADKLVATVRYREEGATTGTDHATFTNIYNVSGTAETVIRGHKTLTVTQGQKVLAGGDFTFGLYQGTDTSAAPIETVTNWANGNFAFSTISYSAADVGKTFTYTVKEIVPATPNAGITYSNASFQVDVQIIDNGDGTIRAEQTVTGGGAIGFENEYFAQPATYTISGRKQLTGRNLQDGEFTFHLYQTGADFVVSGNPTEAKNAANGSFSFGTVTYTQPGTYYYVVREDIPGVDEEDRLGGVSYDAGVYQITVQVSDNGLGQLHANATVYRPGSTGTEVVFRNGYTTTPATLILNAQKTYDKPMAGNDFTFKLEGDIDGTAVSQEKRNDAAGKVVFDALTFEKEGTYTFHVTEIENKTSFPWIDFDPTDYTVTVTVTDNGAGEMVAAVKYATQNGDIDSIHFKNTYKIIEGAEVTLGGNKYYLGDDLQTGQFEFGLYQDAACTQLIGQTVSNTVESIDLGKFVFPTIEYKDIHVNDLPATYTYYIKEILPAGIQEVDDGNGGKDYMLDGVFYDTSVYKIEVVLTDNNTGGVNVQTLVNGVENDEVAFTNAYNIVTGTQVVLRGNKIVHNKNEIGTYEFGLYDSHGNELSKVTNNAEGVFEFDAITYSAADAGQTFTYTVKEIIPADAVNNVKDGITYDTTVYTVTVEVKDDGVGGLEEIVHITGGGTNNAIIFNNYYNITGTGSTTIEGQKYYNNTNGTAISVGANDFSFGLFENNTLVATSATAAGGAFNFQLHYGPADAGKTFTYEVREIAGEAGYIEYDETVYTVVVAVKDNGTGGIDVTKTVNGVADAQAVFTNTYVNTGEESLVLGGVKKYFDTRLQQYVDAPVNGFTFLLKDEHGEVIRQATNTADGTFSFRALEYTAADIDKTYRYTIEERNDGLTYIDYDATVYDVVVEITDNGTGGIHVEKTVTVSGAPAAEVVFENKYTVSGTAELVLEGMKLYTNSLTGHLKDLPADTFSFHLSGNGIEETVGNKAGGAFTFPAISYDADDIGSTYTYTVSEVKGGLDYVIYDADVFTVTVDVFDNGRGGVGLKKTITVGGSETAAIAFDNYYDVVHPGSVEILGTKSYTDGITGVDKTMEAGMFTFKLTGHGQNQTVTNDADGNFRFQIDYTKADIGKEYTYTVYEVRGGEGYITYDTDRFQIHVKVADNGTGGLEITKYLGNTQVNTLDVAFQNTYNTVSGGSVAVSGVKTYIDGRTQYAKPIEANMFSFNIKGGNNVDETVTCDTNGNFHFSALTYDATDIGNTYTYEITEVAGDKTYIDYSGKTYTLKVTVESDNKGGLKITKTLDGTGADTIHVAFDNVYNIITGGEVEVSGIKTYIDSVTQNNKQVPAGMFQFKISDHNGYTETVSNAADGTFAFTSLTYDADDIGKEFTYTIEEVKGDNVHVTYDNAKHTLVVFVTDNGQGGLAISKWLDGEPVDAVQVSYKNIYHAPDDEVKKDVFLASAPTISIDGEKVNVGDTLLYKITYTNADDTAATVQITDKIPAHTSYVDGSASDNGVFAEGAVKWNVQLAAGETKTVSFQVKVNDPEVFIDNQATTFDGVNQLTTNTVSNHTYEEVEGKDVALAGKPEISIDGKLVQVGQILVYTIDYTNITESPVNVTITDQIPAHTKLVDDGKGTQKDGVLTWEIKDIQPREKVTVSFQVEVTDPGAVIENRAQIFDGSNKVTNKVTNSTPEKTVDKQTASLGETLTYTLTYKNVTGAPAKLVITDKLSDALAFVEGSAGEGIYANGVITWTFDNVPADGEIKVTFQATVKTGGESVLNSAQFVENGADAVFTNETETKVLTPDLTIKKQQSVNGGKVTDKVQTVEAGDEVTYILTVTNNGKGDAYGISVADKIAKGLEFVSADNGGKLKDGILVWDLAELKAGQSVELTFKVKIPAVSENAKWTNVAAFTYTNNPDGNDDVTESNKVELSQPAPETPDTGDHFQATVFISLMILSAFGIVAVMVKGKKQEEEENIQ